MDCNQIGVQVSKQEFADFLNSIQPGQFFHVRGYVNAEGEKADHWLRFGVKYGNIKARDVNLLRQILAGKQMPDVTVKHGVYVSPDQLETLLSNEGENLVRATIQYDHLLPDGTSIGVTKTGHIDLMDNCILSNRKGNKKDGYKVPATISYSLPYNHPLVVAAIGEAELQGTILQGLLRPREATVEYDKEAQSAYSLEKDGTTKWYLRDVLYVRKVVRVEGNYEFSASLPINAVKKSIQSQWLLTGKYRQFVLTDGQFEAITIEGQAVLVDGINEDFYFALPETVKETLVETAVETAG
jgi:hypothetical protein